ncbi:hypothetical protein MK805_08935 [Shimazuella sp. AN120528]|uniref:hypothetical protein n=1 Tax=Shimazuella soli TaxID=1892854 RepID=UPI001F0D9984|nr:hypothetical protein [Shimazuella soli]MCH5585094.1 hypothetical protein [Shimazuella soli]
MKRWQRFLAMVLCTMVFVLAMSSSTANADSPNDQKNYDTPTSGDILPKDKTDKNSKSMFKRYGLAALQLDYVQSLGPDKDKQEFANSCVSTDGGLAKSIYNTIIKGVTGECASGAVTYKFGKSVGKYFDVSYYINILNTILWQQYVGWAAFATYWLTWAFSLEIINIIIDSYNRAIESVQKTVWDPMMYLMWAVAVAWMVYYWIVGKTTQLWSTFVKTILVIALSATLFANMGNYLQTMTRVSHIVGVTILTGITGLAQDDKINSESGEAQQEAVSNALKENLYGIFIDLPYMLVNFGSPELANKIPWQNVLKVGYDMGGDKRADVIVKAYNKMKDQNDKTGMDQVMWLTPSKAVDRLVNSCMVMFFATIGIFCFAYVAVLALIWQFIALGRGLAFAFYLIMSLLPTWGLEPAVTILWKIGQSLCMYAVMLAFLGTETKLVYDFATADQVQKAGLINTWVIIILLTLAFHRALGEVTQKLANIPLGNGRYLQGYSTEAQDALKKAYNIAEKGAGYAIAGVSAMYGSAGGVKAGMAIARRGVGGAAQQGINHGLEKVADYRSDQRDEKKKKRDEDRDYEDRKEGLNEDDAKFADQMRRDYGVDVTTAEGRNRLEQLNPELAKKKQEELYRIRDNAMANAMARHMPLPDKMPAKGTPEYDALVAQFGKENVEDWQTAQTAEMARFKNEMDSYKKLNLKRKAMKPKPRIETKNIREMFEGLQSVRAEGIQNEINRVTQAAAMGPQVIELSHFGKDLTRRNQKVVFSGDFGKYLPSNEAERKQAMADLEKQAIERLESLGLNVGNIPDSPVTIKVDMPVKGGTGTQKVDIKVSGLNAQQQKIHQQFDDSALAMKINEILEQKRGGMVSPDELRKTIADMQAEFTKNLAGSAKAPAVFENFVGKAGLDMNQMTDMLGAMLQIDMKDLYTYKDRMEKISKRLKDVERKQQQQRPPNTPPPGGRKP